MTKPYPSIRRRPRNLVHSRQQPTWANLAAMARVYLEAWRLTLNTGIVHHVDHIVPLKHPLVCGLHCEANLRVVPALVNLSKGNHHVC